MSLLNEFFANPGCNGMEMRILTGRDGLRQFLRLHQNTSKAPYLHYRDVNALMIAGHGLVGVFNNAGKIKATAAVLFGDRPLPYNAHMKNEFVRTRCAVLAFKSIDAGFYYMHQSLLHAACALAAKNRRALLLDGKILWNTDTAEKVEKIDSSIDFTEPKSTLFVRQALTA